MEVIWVALIAAAAAIGSPVLVMLLQNRRLDAIRIEVAAVKTQTDGVLTAAFRSEIAAVEAQVVAMRRPSPDTQAAIRATEARLVAMRRNLAEREKAVSVAQRLVADGTNGTKE